MPGVKKSKTVDEEEEGDDSKEETTMTEEDGEQASDEPEGAENGKQEEEEDDSEEDDEDEEQPELPSGLTGIRNSVCPPFSEAYSPTKETKNFLHRNFVIYWGGDKSGIAPI